VFANDYFDDFGGPEMLGRLDAGRNQQRNHLFHRLEDGSDGIHPRQFVLPGNVRSELEVLA
jgi:hypothetical protein